MKPRSEQLKNWIGFALGLLLLLAAAVVLISSPGMIDRLWTNLRNAPSWTVVVLVIAPVVSWILVALCLRVLLLRHGRVDRVEMLMLVGSAWLLNHLPMRPGLIGRVGYHKAINNIRVRDAVEATIWSLAFGALANVIVIAITLLAPSELSILNLSLALLAPIVLMLFVAVIARARSRAWMLLLIGLAYRYADLLIWLVRYAVVFVALGIDATPVQIAMVTAVSQFTQLIPITGGGLGFREWGVGLTAQQSGHAMKAAIGADLINRAIETLWVLPIGLLSIWWVARRVRTHDAELSRTRDAMPSQ
jgi:uncharacterized membrane protein YbhN (UPF0104 family)